MKGSDTRNIRNGADAPQDCADEHPGMCRLASSYCAVGITASYAASVVAMALLAAVVLSHTEGQRRGTRTQAVVRAIASTVRDNLFLNYGYGDWTFLRASQLLR